MSFGRGPLVFLFWEAFGGADLRGNDGQDQAAVLEAGEDPASVILGKYYNPHKDLDTSLEETSDLGFAGKIGGPQPPGQPRLQVIVAVDEEPPQSIPAPAGHPRAYRSPAELPAAPQSADCSPVRGKTAMVMG